MKKLSIIPSDFNFDQLEILKLQNEREMRKDSLFFAFLFIDALIIISALILYAFHPEYFSFLIDHSGYAIASIIPAIKIKKDKKKNSDDANLSKIKEGKGKDQEKKINRSSLYKGIDHLSMKDQKNKRSKLRNKLDGFCKSILGLDRSKEEKDKSIKEFNQFYKENWKINDYKIDNFSNRSDEMQRKEYQLILDLARKELSK